MIEEKIDEVKEYVAFRELPKALASRIKKHYTFYYTKVRSLQTSALQGLVLSARSPPD